MRRAVTPPWVAAALLDVLAVVLGLFIGVSGGLLTIYLALY